MNYKSIIFLSSILVMISCSAPSNEADEPEVMTNQISLTKEQISKSRIETGPLKKVDLAQYVTARGIIDVPPTHRASINVFHGGFVRKLDLLPGQQVGKGELLFTIQNPEFITMQESYLETKSKLSFLESDYERQKQLVSESITSEKKFKQAESDYQVMKAKLESMRGQLELINVNIKTLEKGTIVSSVPVYAPIAGFVSDLSINKGKYLSPQDVALQVINTEHMHLELKVYEKDVSKLKEGQKISFKVDNDDRVLEGEVHMIEKAIDQNERSVNVHGHLPEDSKGLVVGMYAEARIEVGTTKAYALPSEAIVDMDGAQFILYKVNSNQDLFEKVEVKTGIRSGEWTEIKNYAELENKELVFRGAYDVMN